MLKKCRSKKHEDKIRFYSSKIKIINKSSHPRTHLINQIQKTEVKSHAKLYIVKYQHQCKETSKKKNERIETYNTKLEIPKSTDEKNRLSASAQILKVNDNTTTV